MSPTLKNLAISSLHEAAELQQDLGIRFDDFTPDDSDTWNRQTLYLNQYARTRTLTHAARAAGVSIHTARTWQTENTLGFNHRLEIAVLEYTEEIEVLLIERVRKPDVPPSLLSMLLRAHLPEKYGPARRDGAPRDNYHDRDDDPDTLQHDQDSLDDIRRDIHDLKQFAGLTEPDLASIGADSKPAPSASPATSAVNPSSPSVRPEPVEGPKPDSQTTHPVIPAQAGIHPSPSVPSAPSAVNPPTLNRRQRRQLQRQQRKQSKHAPYPDTGTKQPNSHRPRAPN